MSRIYKEECARGFKVKKLNKTTKSGTTVIYVAIKDESDMGKYKALINEMVTTFNNKWNENLQLS